MVLLGIDPVMLTEFANSFWKERISPLLLNYFIKTTEALKRLRADHDGEVSFEYIIVATCIVSIVFAAYTSAGANSISGAMNSGFVKISAAMNTLP
jgi:Flp pilus assembly pilin Flp